MSKPRITNTRIALTFGDAGENHAGMEMVGDLGEAGSGFTVEELIKLKDYFGELGFTVDYVSLNHPDLKGTDKYNAGVLVIRNYISGNDMEQMFYEQSGLDWDRKYWDRRRQKVLNKHARANLIVLDGNEQEPNYEKAMGRIVDGNKLEQFRNFKIKMVDCLTKGLGNEKAKQLICEGNKYFDLKKCGIGYHGDAERRKVICLSLGGSEYPIQWVWFKKSKPVHKPFRVELNSGDLYIMSEKAVGNDWRKSSDYTLRHAAGCDKYIGLDGYKPSKPKIVFKKK